VFHLSQRYRRFWHFHQFFFNRKFIQLCRSQVSKTLHSGPPGGRLAIPLKQLRVMGCLGDFGGFFSIFNFFSKFKCFWRPHLYTWRTHYTSIRYLWLSRSMFFPDTFWLRATVLELRAPKPWNQVLDWIYMERSTGRFLSTRTRYTVPNGSIFRIFRNLNASGGPICIRETESRRVWEEFIAPTPSLVFLYSRVNASIGPNGRRF